MLTCRHQNNQSQAVVTSLCLQGMLDINIPTNRSVNLNSHVCICCFLDQQRKRWWCSPTHQLHIECITDCVLGWIGATALCFVQMAETMYSSVMLALKLLVAFCPEAGPQQEHQNGWPRVYVLTLLQVCAFTVITRVQ